MVQSVPAAMSQIQGSDKPRISTSRSSNGDLRIRVQHREYIQDINGSIAYAVTSLALNPGVAQTFPWLAALARLFESYKFNRLAIQYRTLSSTATAGKVLLSVDWDASDAAPSSKQAQLQERSKADGAAWQSFDLICDKQDLEKFGPQRYVRQVAVANTDIKTYDVGNLQVGTQSMSGSSAVGELYLEYDVELMTPNTAAAPLAGKMVSGGTVSNAAFFGTAPVSSGSIPISADATGEIVTIGAVGSFLVEWYFTGTISSETITAANGATIVSTFADVQDGSHQVKSQLITTTTSTSTLTFSAPTGTVTASAVRVTPYTLT